MLKLRERCSFYQSLISDEKCSINLDTLCPVATKQRKVETLKQWKRCSDTGTMELKKRNWNNLKNEMGIESSKLFWTKYQYFWTEMP